MVTSQASWLLLSILASLLFTSTDAHMAMLYPRPRGGVGTKDFDWRIHQFVGYEGFKYPCGGYPKGPNTNLKAGQVVNVRFWSSAMSDKGDDGKLPDEDIEQARHGGGMCEFSLSYDGGESFHVIGTYTKTCPDAVYEWPVKIPDNAPSCDEPGKCLFAWSWTANLVPQFYHNCADVTIKGVKDGELPKKTIQIYDFGSHKKDVTFDGDGKSHSLGTGPIKSEVEANTQ